MKTTMVIKTCGLIIDEMLQKGFSEHSISFYSHVYQTLKAYLTENKFDDFSDKIRDDFLLDIYGIRIDDFSHLSKHKQKSIRAALLIQKYNTSGNIPVLLQYKPSSKSIPDAFLCSLRKYEKWLEEEGLAFATRQQRKARSELFLEYLASLEIYDMNTISVDLLYDFVQRFSGYSNRTTNLYILILNDFLRFLYLTGSLTSDFSNYVSTIMKRDEKISSVWSQDELKAYLDTIDRATKIGKRDFALSLIAIRLGLRGSDIRNLQLSDFDWEKHVISICQIKTKEIQVLPLPDDVGWAIIDYIQNARPNTEYKNLFVRMTPPFSPYSNYGFQSMIDKYCYAARINHENMKSGLHSFRHSLATQLMTDQVPVQIIRSVLGHKSPQTVREYLKVNLNLLKECALSPEVIYG